MTDPRTKAGMALLAAYPDIAGRRDLRERIVAIEDEMAGEAVTVTAKAISDANVHGADACAWGGKCGCERRAGVERSHDLIHAVDCWCDPLGLRK